MRICCKNLNSSLYSLFLLMKSLSTLLLVVAAACTPIKSIDEPAEQPNHPPTIQLVHRGESYLQRTIRREMKTVFEAEVKDVDGDELECQFEFSDGYKRSWHQDCTMSRYFKKGTHYFLVARVRDSYGAESTTKAVLQVVDNIPPRLRVLPPCHELTDNGECLYHTKGEAPLCWDCSKSFDEDGSIVGYFVDPAVEGGVSGTYSIPTFCGGYRVPGKFKGMICAIDNEKGEDCLEFWGVAE